MGPNQADPNNPNPNNPSQTQGEVIPSSPTLPGEPQPINPSDTSTLDNPLGVPAQPPSIDSNTGFGWPPSPADSSSQPEAATPTPPPTNTQIEQPPTPAEPAPADLSGLINTEAESQVYTPPLSQPETLVTPQNGAGVEVPNIPTGGGSGIPKWLIGLGVGLLLAVTGASAYFILGIGKPTEETPQQETTQEQTSITPPSLPSPTPLPTIPTSPQATGSGSFGTLPSPPPPATSAADLLKQRQGR